MRVLVFLAALIASAPAAATGDEAAKTIVLRDFSAIDISGAYELDVDVGGDYHIELVGDAGSLARAEATVRNGALVLGSRKRHFGEKHSDHGSVRAVVSMPTLERLTVSGVVDADIKGVDAGAFSVNLSGVGDVAIAGRCGELAARVSGVGELDARSLECKVADIALSGMGEASVHAREKAKAEVSGMGEINIYGAPKVIEKRGGFLAEITVHQTEPK